MTTAEQLRLDQADRPLTDVGDSHATTWRTFGPYVAERAWGSVREDYSADGDAWNSFPFDHAVRRTYRWNEDGLSAWCDDGQRVCLGLALWNGVDPVLKERYFGLANSQGNHGEDVKDYWWYVDDTPTHSYQRTRYAYPTTAFPYEQLVAENARRDRHAPEYELIDTGVFADDRYVMVTSDWAKRTPDDLCLRVEVTNRGPDAVMIDVLPTVWFRNTWSWDHGAARPELRAIDDPGGGSAVGGRHAELGGFTVTSTSSSSTAPELLFCENETDVRALYDSDVWAGAPATPYPKGGINDHVVHGAATINPDRTGTKAAFRHRLTIAPGDTGLVRVRLRLTAHRDAASTDAAAGSTDVVDGVVEQRHREADAFWNDRLAEVEPQRRHVARQALAGLLSCQQYYAYDVQRWLDGDPTQPPPPAQRLAGRNHRWTQLTAADVISMPDSWEYPWFASWDLAFHCVVLALVDPAMAKRQLRLLLREWYQHPCGQLPAYEWNFSDANPPVHAWAAWQIYRIDGSTDTEFLKYVLPKLLVNVTSWVDTEDAEGNDLFEGGFLGLDNIGPFDRSAPLPGGRVLEQSDGTAWMAAYCLQLLTISLELCRTDPTYSDLATGFLEHFGRITAAANGRGLWHADSGLYFDQIRDPGGHVTPIEVHSAVGLIPVIAATRLTTEQLTDLPDLSARLAWLTVHRPRVTDAIWFEPGHRSELLAVVGPDHLTDIVSVMLDESEFLSPYGIRSLSAYHRDHPLRLTLDGHDLGIDYEPAESTTGLFGGNSNWRGPVWFPLNALFVQALRTYAEHLPDLAVEFPTGSGSAIGLAEVADRLTDRLVSMFLPGDDGVRPCQAGLPWQDDVWFNEYFHADTGFGLGASHQTGWTSLVAALLLGWPR